MSISYYKKSSKKNEIKDVCERVCVCGHMARKATQIYMALNSTWLKFNLEFDTLITKKL